MAQTSPLTAAGENAEAQRQLAWFVKPGLPSSESQENSLSKPTKQTVVYKKKFLSWQNSSETRQGTTGVNSQVISHIAHKLRHCNYD